MLQRSGFSFLQTIFILPHNGTDSIYFYIVSDIEIFTGDEFENVVRESLRYHPIRDILKKSNCGLSGSAGWLIRRQLEFLKSSAVNDGGWMAR